MADERADMADENGTQQAGPTPRTFTQEEVNELMGKVRREVSGRYADYDALREKATAYDEAQEAAKTDAQRTREAIEAARAEAKKANDALAAMQAERDHAQLVAKVAEATGVPASLITGADEEAMTASAIAIAAYAKTASTAAPVDKGGAASGHKPMSDDSIREMTNPADRVAAYARAYEDK